ncbi:hypothetical protein PUN28_003180 [Cardiocondyla obscurior]|uniref:Uncharacterized protein n=1 Tax=Cardiocondyla obscurior TaxID=286306 RepID=A0AAW2GJB4_9HYME
MIGEREMEVNLSLFDRYLSYILFFFIALNCNCVEEEKKNKIKTIKRERLSSNSRDFYLLQEEIPVQKKKKKSRKERLDNGKDEEERGGGRKRVENNGRKAG